MPPMPGRRGQDTLAIGDHDDFDILLGGVLQHVFNAVAVVIGDKHPRARR